ncbi:Hypothetical predicted protein [Cloeon dipterum]|uniref:Uncharacterized protein n=1 Tax=Cloeon dipterum TaxID=197152 RepID=A0A8S1DDX9_9INSE|nr:Hypothetical predicted protein [Cloeon dipterum]
MDAATFPEDVVQVLREEGLLNPRDPETPVVRFAYPAQLQENSLMYQTTRDHDKPNLRALSRAILASLSPNPTKFPLTFSSPNPLRVPGPPQVARTALNAHKIARSTPRRVHLAHACIRFQLSLRLSASARSALIGRAHG